MRSESELRTWRHFTCPALLTEAVLAQAMRRAQTRLAASGLPSPQFPAPSRCVALPRSLVFAVSSESRLLSPGGALRLPHVNTGAPSLERRLHWPVPRAWGRSCASPAEKSVSEACAPRERLSSALGRSCSACLAPKPLCPVPSSLPALGYSTVVATLIWSSPTPSSLCQRRRSRPRTKTTWTATLPRCGLLPPPVLSLRSTPGRDLYRTPPLPSLPPPRF